MAMVTVFGKVSGECELWSPPLNQSFLLNLNSEVSMTYWKIGKYIAGELDAIGEEKYGAKIVATLSRQLTWSHFIELARR